MTPHRPSFEDFAGRADQAPCVPVYRQLTGDGLTPVSAFRRIERTPPSFLFESVIGGEKVGRFSFLGTEPFLRFEARGDEVAVTSASDPGAARRFTSDDPFRELQELVERYRSVHLPGLPRFAGGAVG
jgi:anthranilate synthase component I